MNDSVHAPCLSRKRFSAHTKSENHDFCNNHRSHAQAQRRGAVVNLHRGPRSPIKGMALREKYGRCTQFLPVRGVLIGGGGSAPVPRTTRPRSPQPACSPPAQPSSRIFSSLRQSFSFFVCFARHAARRTNERTNERRRRRRRRRRSTMATRGDTKCCERLEGGLKHVMQCRYIDRLPSTCCCCAHEVCDERARKCAAGFRFSTCDDELMSEFGMMRIYIERVFLAKKITKV